MGGFRDESAVPAGLKFKWNGADYVMLVKVYGPALEGQRRYGPPELVSIDKQWVMGNPETANISTSYVES